MIKKIISLLCCIAPIGVMAEPVLFEGKDVSTNGKIYTNLSKWQDAINADNTIVIKQGTVIRLQMYCRRPAICMLCLVQIQNQNLLYRLYVMCL